MRGLQTLVIVMGVLIVAGVAVLAVTIVRRVAAVPAATSFGTVPLDQPAGTRIAGITAAGDRVALWLTGGGPDRVLLVDPRAGGKVVGILTLAP